MDPQKNLGTDLRIIGLGFFTVDGAAGPMRKLGIVQVDTGAIAGALGSLQYRAERLSVEGLQSTLGRNQITADSAELFDFSLATADGNVAVSAHRVDLPRGFLFTSHDEFLAPQATLEDVRVVIEDLAVLKRRRRPGQDEKEQAGEGKREPMDLHFLDVLEGQLNIDLAVDMTLPWLGERRVTHYFRVPIEQGTIDYDKLEGDVHWLEGAFLNLELAGDMLVLARDLPLVPYSGKALLQWPLEPKDIPVAMYHRVHVRNLLRWQVPPSDKKPGKGKKLQLHALAMKNIELSLHAKAPARVELPGGAQMLFGDDEHAGLVDLQVKGELRYQAGDAAAPTTLSGKIGLLDVTLKDLKLGAANLIIDRLHLDELDHVEVGFRGFVPYRLEIRLSRMTATNLRIQVP